MKIRRQYRSGPAALALLAVTGCGSTAPKSPDAAAAPAPASPAVQASATPQASAPAADSGRLGAPGSACELPVSFDLLPAWKATPIDVSRLTSLQASFMRSGLFDTVCSVDGKPAGKPGFVRVYASDTSSGNRRDDLKAFVLMFTKRNGEATDYEVRDAKYTDLTVAGQSTAEATWTSYNTTKKKGSQYAAFTLDTPRGPVVVLEVPYTPAEKANVRPAYELVKKTMTVN